MMFIESGAFLMDTKNPSLAPPPPDFRLQNQNLHRFEAQKYEPSVLIITKIDYQNDTVLINDAISLDLIELTKLFKNQNSKWSVIQNPSGTRRFFATGTNGQNCTFICKIPQWEALARMVEHFETTNQNSSNGEAKQLLEFFGIYAETENYQMEKHLFWPANDEIKIYYDSNKISPDQLNKYWLSLQRLESEFRRRKDQLPKKLVVMLHSPIPDDSYRSNCRPTNEGFGMVVNTSQQNSDSIFWHEAIHMIKNASTDEYTTGDLDEGMATRLGEHFEGKSDSANSPNKMPGYRHLVTAATKELRVNSSTRFIDQIGMEMDFSDQDYDYTYLVGYTLLDAIFAHPKFMDHWNAAIASGETPYLVLHQLSELLHSPEIQAKSLKHVSKTKFRISNSTAISLALEKLGFPPNEILDFMQQRFKHWRDIQSSPKDVLYRKLFVIKIKKLFTG